MRLALGKCLIHFGLPQEASCGTVEFWEVYLISLEEGCGSARRIIVDSTVGHMEGKM